MCLSVTEKGMQGTSVYRSRTVEITEGASEAEELIMRRTAYLRYLGSEEAE